MKIAIPTKNNVVDDHFGHCELFSIFEIDENKNLKSKQQLPWADGCGCKSNIVETLREMGVTTMLAGNMGQGALNVLLSQGMEVVRGCQGDTEVVVEAYLDGRLTDKQILCQSHHNCH
jgi:predicted Fe-Mo cluster-binding NifX family protein